MNVLDKLSFDYINSYFPINKDYEYEAVLNNHKIPNSNVYRLHYMGYFRVKRRKARPVDEIRVVDDAYDMFIPPKGMSHEEVFAILSYLSDYIERYAGDISYHESVTLLDDALDIKRLGFKRVSNSNLIDNYVDLYTVVGRLLLFKHSSNYYNFFHWYIPNVKYNQVQNIYRKYGMNFGDIFMYEVEEQGKKKSLKK